MSQYKSLLGLNEFSVDSLDIANLDLTNTNIIGLNTDRVPEDTVPINLYFTEGRFDTRLATKSTTDIKEGTNLYYTDGRFDTRFSNKSTTDLKEGLNYYWTDNRFDTRLALKSTTDLKEGTNLYYTDGRFDTRFSTKSTTNLAEGTNLYYTTARANTDFDARLLLKTTADLKEGTNLYYTTARANTDFDTRLTTKSTTNLAEGTNLYYTTARANTDFDTRLATKSTTNLAEGTNLYYTTVRANTDFDTRLATKSTTNLAEETNLYYTNARFDTQLATKSTTNLAEGTNLYYTTARANTDFDTRLATKSTTNLAEGTNLYYTNARFDTQLATKSTTNLSEGTNLYYTTARANTDFDTRLGTKSMDALSDVIITTPANGQLLSYNGTNWINSTGSSTYLALTGGTMSRDINMGTKNITNVNLVDGVDVSVLDGSAVKTSGNQTIAGIKTYSSGLEITGNSTNATTKGTFVVFNSTANIGTIGCLDMGTGVNYNFEIIAKKVSFVIDGAIVGWVNASGIDCNSSKIANLGTPTLATDGATKGYADTLDGQNVKLTGDQTITGIKIFNGTRNDIRGLTLLNQADFNNVDIINGGNITYNGARILNQNGGDAFFSQTTGNYQSFLFTLNTASSGTADQRGYVFTNVAYDVAKGAGLYISQLTDAKFASADIVRFNNAGGMKFYGALDMNSNNVTNGGTITGTTITASTKITTATGKPIIIGNTTKGTGPSAGLEIYGAYGDFTAGPHIRAITTEDTYPIFTIANLGHNNIIFAFDAYLDNAGWKSSYANANFRIAKVSNTLSFGYKSGIAAGSAITWSEAMNISNAGLLTTNAGISTTTLATSDKITTASGKPIIIGNSTKGVGATGGLELYGTGGDIGGPHIQAITTADVYPTFQLLNWNHDNICLTFDAYWDGTNWKSSASGSNFQTSKAGNKLFFNYKSGITAGSNITWTDAMNINTAGLLTANAGITYSGLLTTTTNNGAKIGIQGAVDGGSTRGIFMWNTDDSNWGIYMAQSGANKALNGVSAAPATSANGITSYAIRFRAAAGATGGFIWENANNAALMSLRGSDGYLWVATGMTIDSTITINNSAAQLHFTDGTTTTCGIRWSDDNHGIFCKRNSDQMYFREYGTCYFQTTGANTRATLTSSGIVNTSDKRHKTDIRDVEFCGLDFINALKPKCFKLKESKRENCGFIAQDIEELVKKKINMSKDDGTTEELKTMNYFDLIAPIVKATQELSEKVVNLEKENKILLNILQDQANQLAEIRAVVFPNPI